MTLIPYAEWRPDVSDFQSQYTSNIQNVLPRGDGYGPFQGFAALSAALAATCRGFFKAPKTDGSVAIFAATSTKIYKLDNSALTWGDVSKGSSTYSAVTSTDNWTFAQFGNLVFACQINSVLQVYDLTSSSNFADALGSPPQSRYVTVVGKFLVLSGQSSLPYRIGWSGLNDVNSANSWTVGLNSCDVQDFAEGGVVRGVSGGASSAIIFQDIKMRRMTYAAGSSYVFQIDPIGDDIGLYGTSSLIKTNNRTFFLSAAGFMGMQTTDAVPTPIGKERVDRTFLADVDKANLQLCIGASDPRSSRVFWAYKSNSGTTGMFDKMLCYDWALDRWAPIAMSGEYLGSLSQPGLTLEGLDSISGSIDALTASLDSYATSVTPEIACFNSSHVLGFFRGSNLEATLDTPEQTGPNRRRIYVRGFQVISDAPTVYGSASYRETQGTAATQTSEIAMNTLGNCDLSVDARFARGRIRIPAATTWTVARGVDPDFVPVGYK